jgi:PilZ domain-containing protein
MLDVGYERDIIEDFWQSATSKAKLPESETEYCDPRGAMPCSDENLRAFHRFFLRGKALLKHRGVFHGVYTKDVSRQGVGFISPVQLLPKEQVQMRLPGANELSLEVTRCRRVCDNCFDAGAKFVLTRGSRAKSIRYV